MTVHRRINVGDLLEMHPGAHELFSWYGVALDSHTRRMTLEQLCKMEGLDVEDTLAELETDDEDDDDDDDEDVDDDRSALDDDMGWYDEE